MGEITRVNCIDRYARTDTIHQIWRRISRVFFFPNKGSNTWDPTEHVSSGLTVIYLFFSFVSVFGFFSLSTLFLFINFYAQLGPCGPPSHPVLFSPFTFHFQPELSKAIRADELDNVSSTYIHAVIKKATKEKNGNVFRKFSFSSTNK